MSSSNFLTTIVVGLLAGILGTAAVMRGFVPGLALAPGAPVSPSSGSATATAAPGASDALTYDQQVIKTVQQASPAVVSIIISKDVPVVEQYFDNVPAPQNPFNDFFGGGDPFSQFNFQVPKYRQNGTQKQEIGGGSGFLVSADGLIVTNRHVVAQEDAEYTVFLNSGEKYTAKIVARDPVNDIAVLKIEANGLPFLSFGESDQLQVGQTVIAIGNALGEFRNTVSRGVVSGLARSIEASGGAGGPEQLEKVIQTDAAINPGNSGGPLLDLTGHVIGVNVAVALGSENIGFALPANVVKDTVEGIKKDGRIIRPYLGVRYTPITPALKTSNNLPVDYGVLILRGETPDLVAVVPGSPANKAGLVENDIILEFDGKKLDADTSLAELIRTKKVGDTSTLKVLHNGQEKTVSVTLEEIPQ